MQSDVSVNVLHRTCMGSGTCCNEPTPAWYVSVVPVTNSVGGDGKDRYINLKASLSLCCQVCKKRMVKLRRYAAQVNCDSQTLLWQMLVTDNHPIYFKQDVHVIDPKDASLPASTALSVQPGMIQFKCGEYTLLMKAIGCTRDRFQQIVCCAMDNTDLSPSSIELLSSKFVEQVHDVLEMDPTTITPGPFELCTPSQMHDECHTLQTHCQGLKEQKSLQMQCDGSRINSLLAGDTRPFRTAQVCLSDIDHNACCMELYGLAGEVRRLGSMAVIVPGANETFVALREEYSNASGGGSAILRTYRITSGLRVITRIYIRGMLTIGDQCQRQRGAVARASWSAPNAASGTLFEEPCASGCAGTVT